MQQSTAVPARARLTSRLREKIRSAIASGNRAVSEVAGEYGVAWATAHRALIALAARWLLEPEPTRVLGIDETRAQSVRWVLEEAGWRRSNPWMTSFVNADPTTPGGLLGLAPGRSGACVIDWLGLQSPAFRAGVELVDVRPAPAIREPPKPSGVEEVCLLGRCDAPRRSGRGAQAGDWRARRRSANWSSNA